MQFLNNLESVKFVVLWASNVKVLYRNIHKVSDQSEIPKIMTILDEIANSFADFFVNKGDRIIALRYCGAMC